MSHYTVAVFTKPGGKTVEELLEPFDEITEVAPYVYQTKQEIIDEIREEIKKLRADMKAYAEDSEAYLKKYRVYWLTDENVNPRQLKEYYAKKLSKENLTDEEIYKDYREQFDDESYNENGDILSTYNPNSKWDWWCVGGRWSGLLRVKDENGNITDDDEGKIKNIDFSPSTEETAEHERWWDVVIGGAPLEEGEDKFSFLLWGKTKEEIIETYGTKENYVAEKCKFRTYALLTPEGEWFEPGKMGWWALTTETPESRKDYNKFFDDFLAKADPEWTLTIVDCHI